MIRIVNLISLDVAIGAVACAAMFAHLFQVRILPYGYAALGITVWIIYTTDHLLDAYFIQGKAISERHFFHQRYFLPLALLLLIAAVSDLMLVTMLRKPVLVAGLMLASLVLVYLLVQRRLTPLKESVVAVLYSAGVMLPALALKKFEITSSHLMLIFIFMLTTLLNLILFSWFERTEDITHRQNSLAVRMGTKGTWQLLLVLFILQGLLIISTFILSGMGSFLTVLAAMNGMLAWIFFQPDWFGVNNRYRLAGDAVFLFPLISLFLA